MDYILRGLIKTATPEIIFSIPGVEGKIIHHDGYYYAYFEEEGIYTGLYQRNKEKRQCIYFIEDNIDRWLI